VTNSMHTVEVPADECYVAITTKPPGRITDRVAAYAVEGQLPRPIDELCIAWRVISDQLVVVAVDQERADQWLANGALSAHVVSVPVETEFDPKPIEMLRCSYLPSTIRRHRHRRITGFAVAVAVGSLVASFGLHKKTITLLEQTADADAAIISQARDTLPQWREGLTPQLALTGELRRLRSLVNDERQDGPIDSRRALAALFEAWPTAQGIQVESIEAAGDRITLRGVTPSRDAAIILAGTLAEGPSLESGLPRVQTENQREGEVTRLELSLTHSGGAH